MTFIREEMNNLWIQKVQHEVRTFLFSFIKSNFTDMTIFTFTFLIGIFTFLLGPSQGVLKLIISEEFFSLSLFLEKVHPAQAHEQ